MSIPPIVLFMSGNQIELTCYLVHQLLTDQTVVPFSLCLQIVASVL
jgi:hypothetical protein